MIDIIYLNAANQERLEHFENYNEFVRAQQACWIDVPDYSKVIRVTINGHVLDFKGQYGELYHYLLKQDLSAYLTK